MKIHICGIDIGKTVFHLVGLSKESHIVIKKRFSRKQLVIFTRKSAGLLYRALLSYFVQYRVLAVLFSTRRMICARR